MIRLTDVDKSGRLDLPEFLGLLESAARKGTPAAQPPPEPAGTSCALNADIRFVDFENTLLAVAARSDE